MIPKLETSQLDEDGSKSKTESSRKGNLKELVKKNVQTKKSRDDDVTLRATQLQILRVFGSFGQFLQLEDKQHSGLSNKRDKYLKYTIPFKDCKPDFFIGQGDILEYHHIPQYLNFKLNSNI